MKQHYLPECYLNEFTGPKGKLYTLDLEISEKYNKASINEKSPSQICSIDNHYSIDFKTRSMLNAGMHGIDSLFVENNIFGEYERVYNKLINQFKLRKSLLYTDAKLLSKALISLKYRNIYLLKSITKTQLQTMIKDVAIDTREKIKNNQLPLTGNFTQQDLIDYLDHWESDSLADEDLNRQLFLSSMVVRYLTPSDILHEVSRDLLRYKWNILIGDISNHFMTTDNPGFCIDPNGLVYNMHFSNYKFYFPITPLLCVMINDKEIDWDYINDPMVKKINYSSVSSSTIDQINSFSKIHINKYLIAHSKQVLNSYFLNRKAFHL